MAAVRCGGAAAAEAAAIARLLPPPPLLLLLMCAAPAAAQLITYGAREGTPHWTYMYAGRDWTADEAYPACRAAQQSPINVPDDTALARVPASERSTFQYGIVNGANTGQLINNGHTVQLTIPAGFAPSNASLVVVGDLNVSRPLISQNMARSPNATRTRVPMKPLQLHFHTRSEHFVGGRTYPLEMHLVNAVARSDVPGCPAAGCLAVVGVMFELAEEGETSDSITELRKIFDSIVEHEATTTNITATNLDLMKLLPADQSYITYAGSLTTPPCTEGVLWHLMVAPVKITAEQLFKFQMAVGDSVCGVAATAHAAARRRRLSGVFDNYLGWTAAGPKSSPAPAGDAAAGGAQPQPAAGPAVVARPAVPRARAPPPLPASLLAPAPAEGPQAVVAAAQRPQTAAAAVAAAALAVGGAAAPIAGWQPAATPIADAAPAAPAAPAASPAPPNATEPSPQPRMRIAPWDVRSGAAVASTGATATAAADASASANATATEALAPEFVFPAPDAGGCRKLANTGNYRVEQPLNARAIRIWVDATPCNATLAAAVRNSSALARLVGPAGSASEPISVSAYSFAVASNLTLPCPAATGGAGAARAGGGAGWRGLAAALLAAAAALL
ncbi:carbonic anhydrase [Raphidocelis subcapitata]|uniref:Carbonic anhydrase n=1 Tax=Raphidocelis subcapitata TaxID=307507 RepID=A0A2V0PDR9_9CHLO|nr:carbonic anhydrase [Raphidocelis subcapitata]|eukprot:GBF97659.1 carbonic anhydrase [Raphidocelis subcapitata]